MADDGLRHRAASRGREAFAPAKLEAFVAVAEEGTVSAAARRLHISQPALSQTISSLERALGVQLLVRHNSGVVVTPAGMALLTGARALLARQNQLLRALTSAATESRVMQLGIPAELEPDLLRAVARFAAANPDTRVIPRHLPMAAQLARLRDGELDVSFTREHPRGREFDAVLVAQAGLGVLMAGELANRLGGPHAIRLDALAGLEWIGLSRASSPAWYDEVAATLGSHGVDTGDPDRSEDYSIPSVIFTAISSGRAFALASRAWDPVPDTVVWRPLVGDPVVRRTWAVWPALRHDFRVAQLVAAFGPTESDLAAGA